MGFIQELIVKHPASVIFLSLALVCSASASATQPGWSPDGGLVIRGNVVPMTGISHILLDHWIFIKDRKIVAIEDAQGKLPPEAANAPVIDTNGGWIYPGMLNIHNHTAYNHIPLYKSPRDVPDPYVPNPDNKCPYQKMPFYWNRHQWNTGKQYTLYVKHPKNILDVDLNLETEMLKWAEVKALAGGETTIQGTPSKPQINYSLVRNVEVFQFGKKTTRKMGLDINDPNFRFRDTPRMIEQMDAGTVESYFLHVGEGRWDDQCEKTISGEKIVIRDEYQTIKNIGLNRSETVIIHGTALNDSEYADMGQHNMHLVWSPLSNLLLYRVTTRIYLAMAHGVTISLGTDWSPSGSKNLLDELKIADQVIKHLFPSQTEYADSWQESHKALLNDYELVKMVTVNPAAALRWTEFVGTLEVGKHADLFVIAPKSAGAWWENDGNSYNDPIFAGHAANTGRDFTPYRRLINATVSQVQLVVVDGDPLYGDVAQMKQVKPNDYELVCSKLGFTKGVDITKEKVDWTSGTPIPQGDQSLAAVQQALREAMTFNADYLKLRMGLNEEQFVAWLGTKQYGLPGLTEGIDPIRLDPLFVTDDLIKVQGAPFNWFDQIVGSHTINATYSDQAPAPDIEDAYYTGLSIVVPDVAIEDAELLTFVNSATLETLTGEVGLDASSGEVSRLLNERPNEGYGTRDAVLGKVTVCTLSVIENYLLSLKQPAPDPTPGPDSSDGTDATTPLPETVTPDAETVKLLAYLNHESTTVNKLDEQPPTGPGLTPSQAAAIIEHRDGADGQFGTPDDNPFNSEEELDSVPGIGAATITTLKAFATNWTPDAEQNSKYDMLVVFLNDVTTTEEKLDNEVKLISTAARNLIAHRNGADGVHGTTDDNPFDDEAEVDSVKYVGASTIQAIRDWIAANNWQPPVPLDKDSRLLAFINHPTTTVEVLYAQAGLSSRAAGNIISHRDGPDLQPGTDDDDRFETIKELDDIAYVGAKSMELLYTFSSTWTGSVAEPKLVSFVNSADEATIATAITTCNPNIAANTALATAQSIVTSRNARDGQKFTSTSQIDEVSGVGAKTFEALTKYAEYGASCGQ